MPLPAPNLDDRTFQQLVAEAKQRIPRYTPEWTDFNESDPGITLVELHAWLTETILYRLNKLPDLNYIKFLDLLNLRPHPAVAARAELTFKLRKLNDPSDPLVVMVPRNTQVGVDSPDLEQELIFETERTLVAINASLAAVIVPGPGGTRQLVTEYDASTGETRFPHTFQPFGPSSAVGDVCLLGFMVRPFRKNGFRYDLDRFPAVELDLTALVPEVSDADADGTRITGPLSMQSLFPAQIQAQGQTIVWEAYFGIEHATALTSVGDATIWRELNLAQDQTAALTRSGHIYLEVPGGMPAVPFTALSRAFWASLSLTRPPTTANELADDISSGILAPDALDDQVWRDLDINDAQFAALQLLLGDPVANRAAIVALVRTLALSFNRVDAAVFLEASDEYDAAPFQYELSWLRARLVDVPDEPPQVVRFLPNTVGAIAAVTRFQEVLGSSNGRPNQTFRLSRAPVLMDATKQPSEPDLEIVAILGEETERWVPVSDFYTRPPTVAPGARRTDDPIFVLDPDTGTLTFGDGRFGRIPVAGARIVATRYRYGGGLAGNAGPGTIKSLKSSVPNVESVSNVRAAGGGANAELLDEAKLRAPHDLRHRDRAVTAQDFADLAKQTPGVRIQRAFALPLTRAERVNGSSPPEHTLVTGQAGAVTVVVLPENKEDTPQPTEDQLRRVCEHLNSRRLVTTELYVTGPKYQTIVSLKAQVQVDRQADLKAVRDEIGERLLRYFHPLRGGEDGSGWPFGQDVSFGHVYRLLLSIAHVTRVQCLEISPAAGTEPCDDTIAVPDGTLIHLPKTALDVQVSYDAFA